MPDPIRVQHPDGRTGYIHTIGGQRRFVADEHQPGVSGPFEAGLVEAGKFSSTVLDRMAAIAGSEEAQRTVSQAESVTAPLREEFPVSTFIGGMVPGFAIPGGLPAQVVGGAALGALENPESPLLGGTLGGTFGFAGQKFGDILSSRIAERMASGGRQTAMAGAREIGMPLTMADRGGAVAQFFDRQASTVLGRSVKGPSKQRALNAAFADALGVPGATELTGDVLSDAAARAGNVFEGVASGVDNIPLTQNFSDAIGRLEKLSDELVPNARASQALETLKNMALGDKISGQQYNRLRSMWGRFSRNEWRAGGDQVSGEFLDELIGVLDDALLEAAPEFVEELSDARSTWRLLQAVRRGAALDPQGNVNPLSMARSLENTYPGLDLNRFSPGLIGRAQRGNLAATSFPAFRSSGTAERGILQNIPGLTIGLAELAAGGGAGAQLGGGAARGLTDEQIVSGLNGTAEAMIAYLTGTEDEEESE